MAASPQTPSTFGSSLSQLGWGGSEYCFAWHKGPRCGSGDDFWVLGSPGELGFQGGFRSLRALDSCCQSRAAVLDLLRGVQEPGVMGPLPPRLAPGGAQQPLSSSLSPKQTFQEGRAQSGQALGRHRYHLHRWFPGPQPGVFSSLSYFSHHPTFGLINGMNFLMLVDKCPFAFPRAI